MPARTNRALRALQLTILLSAAFGLTTYPLNTVGQVGIRLSKGNPKLAEKVVGSIRAIEIVEQRVFIGTDKGLWVLENEDSDAKQVAQIKEPVWQLRAVGSEIIVITEGSFNSETHIPNLWIVSTDGTATKIQGIEKKFKFGFIVDAILVGDHFFILADVQDEAGRVWVVDRRGIAKLVEVPTIVSMVSVGSEVIVHTSWFPSGASSLFLINQNGEARIFHIGTKQTGSDPISDNRGTRIIISGGSINQSIAIDPEKTIQSELIPDSWLGEIIASILPGNYLPAEKVPVIADYVDSFGNKIDPKHYSQIGLPGKFRFAVAKGNDMPPDEEFSPQGMFTYEINLGANDVHYWIKDDVGNAKIVNGKYHGLPSQYFLVMIVVPLTSIVFVLGCFALAPKISFCHSAIMNPWLRKYFSLGSIPLLVSVFPSLRRHLLRRYSISINKDKDFSEWKERYVCPDEEFYPENFGDKIESERRLLLTGQSGIGKTSYFKRLTANYASKQRPAQPANIFPVYISLTNYGGNSIEDLVYNQLFSYGKITDKELAPMFLEQGGLLIFLDGVNEVQNVTDRQKLSAFVDKFWSNNYICLSSQQSYPEIGNIPKVELSPFSKEQVAEFIRRRARDKEKAEQVIQTLTDEDYQIYNLPRDLEFAVDLLNNGAQSLPNSRTALYKIVFSRIFAKWRNSNVEEEQNLYKYAYTMILERSSIFDSVNSLKFKDVTNELFEQRFLIRRENNYNFRHELIRAYLASEYFYPRWQNVLEGLDGKVIDSNWLEMLKFSCENIADSNEVKDLVYEVLRKSVRKELVKDLVKWLQSNQSHKCHVWEKDFYAEYGSLDFKTQK